MGQAHPIPQHAAKCRLCGEVDICVCSYEELVQATWPNGVFDRFVAPHKPCVTYLLLGNAIDWWWRVKVIRGEREWTYAYNKNGNMVKETSPNDLGESADIPGAGLYTTSTVYDELDRPTSRMLAVNDLSIDQQKMYEANGVGFEYDDCPNGIGGSSCRVRVNLWQYLQGGRLGCTYRL